MRARRFQASSGVASDFHFRPSLTLDGGPDAPSYIAASVDRSPPQIGVRPAVSRRNGSNRSGLLGNDPGLRWALASAAGAQ